MGRVDEGGDEGAPRPQDEYDYSAAFETGSRRVRERARRLAREREELPHQLARLLALPPGERTELVAADPSLASWTLAQRLVEEALRGTLSQARQAAELADLAVAIAMKLEPAEHGTGLVEDLRAHAWSAQGEVRRLHGDLWGAAEAFGEAGRWLDRGSGDALEEARLAELEAVLAGDCGQPAEAHRLLDAAIAIYRRCQDLHLVGRAQVEKARVFAASHELGSAIEWVRQGLGLLDAQRDPEGILAAQHSLMLYLCESGRVHEAWLMLQTARSASAPAAGELLSLRLEWLAGKLLRILGRPAEGEAALAHARAGLVAQGLELEAACVALDLVGLYAEDGRVAAIRQLLEQVPLLHPEALPPAAVVALSELLQEGPREGATGEVVRALGDHLRRARREHKLRSDERP